MSKRLTIRLSLFRHHEEGIVTISNVEHPVEHTYKTYKAAREDYELLAKMLKKFSTIPEVT